MSSADREAGISTGMNNTIYDHLADINAEARTAGGFEEAYLGIAFGYGHEPAAVYDWEKCIELLMEQGMSREDAEEFFDYNTLGAGGRGTMPLFLQLRDADDGTPADGTQG